MKIKSKNWRGEWVEETVEQYINGSISQIYHDDYLARINERAENATKATARLASVFFEKSLISKEEMYYIATGGRDADKIEIVES